MTFGIFRRKLRKSQNKLKVAIVFDVYGFVVAGVLGDRMIAVTFIARFV